MCVWLRLEIQCSHPEGGWELMEALTCSGQNPSVNFLPFFFFLPPQWIFGAHSPVVGFSPSSGVEFVPVFSPVYTSAVPPHAGKGWIDKRLPSCKVSLVVFNGDAHKL